MTHECDAMQRQLLEFGWGRQEHAAARQVVTHMESCAACRQAFDDYLALQDAVRPAESAEPAGGWEAFEQRMTGSLTPKRRLPWWPALAAGLLITLTALNAWFLLRNRPDNTTAPAIAKTNPTVVIPDMSSASVAEAFRNVSEVFEGKANWVMLSDQASDVGLNSEPQRTKDLLVLRLVVTRGNVAVSQMHVAVVPGATVRVTVPARGGEQLQYVISTDANDHQKVAVSLAVEDKSVDAGLGSMATALTMPFGKHMPTGRITTRDGTFDLSMTLDRTGGA